MFFVQSTCIVWVYRRSSKLISLSLFYTKVIMVLINSWFLLICSMILTTLSKPEICYLMECSLNGLGPLEHPLCVLKFNMYNLKPVTAFRRFPTSNKGRHLFDLFYDPEDLGNCIELDVMFTLQDNGIYQALQLNVACQSKGVALLYDADNIWESRCINPVLEFDEITQICNYHAFEQLRFTTIANDTVLVEDLSPHVPPGTRMIFRSAVEPSGHETGQKPKCQCRVLRRDWAHYKRCIRHHRQRIESAVQIQRAREKVVKEFRIGLTILVASCFCTMVVMCWATRDVSDLEFISNVVYS